MLLRGNTLLDVRTRLRLAPVLGHRVPETGQLRLRVRVQHVGQRDNRYSNLTHSNMTTLADKAASHVTSATAAVGRRISAG
jgi:hypothetical protein